jgi:hypothetical protein
MGSTSSRAACALAGALRSKAGMLLGVIGL